ncbi:unnamed protein product [Spodoptera littoralis]|uniref:Tetraspanin n=1 Tax=Spodoptera littoralis TaxID=7109 RepID=A0A9P0IHE9_SPOLI|nr:unnamed protein product [Spodoptera littoralis]CAH1646264.1 unnamed protein product [Spodoptera littoralis]
MERTKKSKQKKNVLFSFFGTGTMRIFKIRRAGPVVVNTDVDRAVRTETEFNMRSIRFLLVIITAMFVVLGTLMMVLGISVYSHFHSFSTFFETGMIRMTPSIMSVFGGAVLVIISLLGLIGSLRLSTCLVNLYAFILMLLFIFQLAIVIVSFNAAGDHLYMNYIDIPVNMYSDPEIQREIDMLQSSLFCCGSYSFEDYLGVTFGPYQPVVVATVLLAGEYVTLTLPESCCFSVVNGHCDRVPQRGCKSELFGALVQNSTVLGIVGISVILMTLLGIIFALLLARSIRKLKSARGLLAWRIRESVIVARQAEEKQQQSQQSEANQVHIEPQLSSTA